MDFFPRKSKLERKRKPKRNEEITSYDGPELITLLKPGEGARTAVLSRRWRHVWRTAPLNLVDSFKGLVCRDEDRIRIISQILAAHPGPVRRLATTNIQLDDNVRIYDDCLRRRVFNKLEDLVLHFDLSPDELPASTLRFASLRVLDIVGCPFPSGCGTLAFLSLNYLLLRFVDITEELLQRIISNSPGIESLVLFGNSGHRRMCLNLPTLKYIAIGVIPLPGSNGVTDLVVKDAASLERILLHAVETGLSVRILGVRNLKMIPRNWLPHLRCFPCLEKLKIKFYYYTSWKTGLEVYCGPSAPIECLDHSLKTIVVQSYKSRYNNGLIAKQMLTWRREGRRERRA